MEYARTINFGNVGVIIHLDIFIRRNYKMKIYLPMKQGWRIDEDAGAVAEQIQERCNSESNWIWSIKPIPFSSPTERAKYFAELTKDYNYQCWKRNKNL